MNLAIILKNNMCNFQEVLLDLNKISNNIESTKNYSLLQSREVKYLYEEKAIIDLEGMFRKEGVSCIPDDIICKFFINFSREDLSHISKTCSKWNKALKKPIFLKKWSKIHVPDTYQLCKNLDSHGWDLHGRTALRLVFINERMINIAKDQHLIYSINKFFLMLMTPVLLEIAFQPYLYIAHKFQALLDAGRNNAAIALMKEQPDLTFLEAKEIITQRFNEMMDKLAELSDRI